MSRGNWRKARTAAFATLAVAAFFVSAAQAQWLNYKTPGIPRLPDGKPNLSAPAPRTADGKPDLSGFWRIDAAGVAETGYADDAVKAQPWAAALTEQRKENYGKDSPSIHCLPSGVTIDMGVGKVVQTRNLLLMLWNGTQYREIFLDGRPLPKDPNPDWMGYSVGHWEGDTLVVETNGFKRWGLDDYFYTNPKEYRMHSDALRTVEHISWKDAKTLSYQLTIDDPKIFTVAWSQDFTMTLHPDWEQMGIFEYVCEENNRCPGGKCGK